MARRLYSIGYEGASLEDFIATLETAGVTVVMDIRDLPASRRRGFSKAALSAALSAAGIEYRHRKPLGDPKPGREAARAGDYDRFERIFLAHIQTEAAEAAMREILALSAEEAVCLLCYERDPARCHRQLVLDRISSMGNIDIQHIGVMDGRCRGRAGARAGSHSREGRSQCQ